MPSSARVSGTPWWPHRVGVVLQEVLVLVGGRRLVQAGVGGSQARVLEVVGAGGPVPPLTDGRLPRGRHDERRRGQRGERGAPACRTGPGWAG